ncbi:oxysterol-binding protein-related protein 1-like isoform X2 [Pomacea canaliculata]|nr:oxysterol-binding protein-related protein 1-like isoform X2 [Pomacea canaliculata]XP_025092485.1 oxysterol-binding protein-related protein 1-like isoform X2 [Pomacea canaliculata]XP_025092487.1 oxysterol-binding protein-related protein 1-like isoform X2 [Pomacea canaliculata]XP_025092488.1 oxysterol-binding protein-related protein 1-like isoform X2 [Pomacea canaliculata]
MEKEEEKDAISIIKADQEFESPEEELLYYARNGLTSHIDSLIQQCSQDGIKLNINCKGKKKSNRGWTPLHLAAYFGHINTVKVLLEQGAEVNLVNVSGDTPLHRASYTGREDVVRTLLEYGADVAVVNVEGHQAKDVTRSAHVQQMLEAAASHEAQQSQSELLEAAASGNMEKLHLMLSCPGAPSLSTADEFGNTALHLAALRGHMEVTVFLLQNGMNPTVKNSKGQTPCDLALSPQIKQVLGVTPIRTLRLLPARFEGAINKKSRLVGHRSLWVVLERGVLSYFQKRGDASTGSRRKGMKYLDEARLMVKESSPLEVKIFFSDGIVHTLSLDPSPDAVILLQKWLNALTEHIAFSTHYTHQGLLMDEDREEVVPLGTMKDTLQTAQAHHQILDKQVQMLQNTMERLSQYLASQASNKTINSQSATLSDHHHEFLRSIQVQGKELLKSSRDMCSALSHAMTIFSQQEEVRQVQLQEQIEKCRVLQESLHALASEHHELERSLHRRPSLRSIRTLTDKEEEFYDCDDDTYGSPIPESFADALSHDLVFRDDDDDVDGDHRRTQLPVPMFSRADFSVWSILKQCIGRELSKITMPVIFNEPLSFLQRISEYFEYADLLRKAAVTGDPLLRMQYVAAFAVSAISSNWERIGKPFNPLLGETYELERRDLGFHLVSEQVSHHPPISAFYVDGDNYSMHGSVLPKLRFWGKSVEVNPKGKLTLNLSRFDEEYSWNNVNCCVHNVIVGKLWVEHTGTMEIVCSSGLKTVLNFKQCGWFGKDLHKVEGYIYSANKEKLRALYGSWVLGLYSADFDEYDSYVKTSRTPSSQSLNKNGTSPTEASSDDDALPAVAFGSYELNIPSQVCLWQATPRPPNSAQYFSFTTFAMSLNQLMDGQAAILPPTDARFRPDIRLMEEGNIDGAAEEKNRLEEKQRAARKEKKKSKQEWMPLWFKYNSSSDDWLFTNHYFERSWTACPDIF